MDFGRMKDSSTEWIRPEPQHVRVRRATGGDFEAIMTVARDLHPKWFDGFAIRESLPLDLRIRKGLVAEDGWRVAELVTQTSSEGRTKISWLSVDLGLHRSRL